MIADYGPRLLQTLERARLILLDRETLQSEVSFGNEIQTLYAILFSVDELIF